MIFIVLISLIVIVGVQNVNSIQDSLYGDNLNQIDHDEISGVECPPQYTGQLPYVIDCRQFLNCWKGRTTIQSCAPGTVFNPNSLECDHPSKVKCEPFNGFVRPVRRVSTASRSGNLEIAPKAKIECDLYAIGQYPHPYDCAKFLECNNGQTFIKDCGPGTVYNPAIRVCDWPYNVDCSTRQDNPDIDDKEPFYGEGLIDARSDMDRRDQQHGIKTGRGYSQSGDYGQSNGYGHGSIQGNGYSQTSTYGQNNGYGHNARNGYDQNANNGHSQNAHNGYGQNSGYDQNSAHHRGYVQNTDYDHRAVSGQTTDYGENNGYGQSGTQLNGHSYGSQTNYHQQPAYHRSNSNNNNSQSTTSHNNLDSVTQYIEPLGFPVMSDPYSSIKRNDKTITDSNTNKHTYQISNQFTYDTQYNTQTNKSQENAHSGGNNYVNTNPIPSYSQITESYKQFFTQEGDSLKCKPDVTGDFAHPHDCAKYLSCLSGKTHLLDCEPGTIYNEFRKFCDSPLRVDCGSRRNKLNETNTYSTLDNQSQTNYNIYQSGTHTTYDNKFDKQQGQVHSYYDKSLEPVQCEREAIGLYPHPYDCAKFLNCDNGKTVIRDCGPGTVFSAITQICDWPRNVDCGTRRLENLNKLSDYEKADKNHNEQNTYNQDQLKNLYNRVPVQCDGEAIGLYPHPYDCTKFLNCDNGKTIIRDCGPGTVFSSITQICDWPKNVNCGTRSTENLYVNGAFHHYDKNYDEIDKTHKDYLDKNLIHDTHDQEISETYRRDYYDYNRNNKNFNAQPQMECRKDAFGLYPHPFDCSKYLNCNGVKTVIQSCAPGTYFSSTKQMCDYEVNVICRQPVLNPQDDLHQTSIDLGKEFSSINNKENSVSQYASNHNYQSTGYNSHLIGKDVTCKENMSGLNEYIWDCSKYLNCDLGKTIVETCVQGLLFNPVLKVCDFPKNVNCSFKGNTEINNLSSEPNKFNLFDEANTSGHTYLVNDNDSQKQVPIFMNTNKTDSGSFAHQSDHTNTHTVNQYDIPNMSVLPLSHSSGKSYSLDQTTDKINYGWNRGNTKPYEEDLTQQQIPIFAEVATSQSIYQNPLPAGSKPYGTHLSEEEYTQKQVPIFLDQNVISSKELTQQQVPIFGNEDIVELALDKDLIQSQIPVFNQIQDPKNHPKPLQGSDFPAEPLQDIANQLLLQGKAITEMEQDKQLPRVHNQTVIGMKTLGNEKRYRAYDYNNEESNRPIHNKPDQKRTMDDVAIKQLLEGAATIKDKEDDGKPYPVYENKLNDLNKQNYNYQNEKESMNAVATQQLLQGTNVAKSQGNEKRYPVFDQNTDNFNRENYGSYNQQKTIDELAKAREIRTREQDRPHPVFNHENDLNKYHYQDQKKIMDKIAINQLLQGATTIESSSGLYNANVQNGKKAMDVVATKQLMDGKIINDNKKLIPTVNTDDPDDVQEQIKIDDFFKNSKKDQRRENEHVMTIYHRNNTGKTLHTPPDYNRVYYKPTAADLTLNKNDTDYLPISEALKLLLHPYVNTNNSKVVNDHTKKMEEKILEMSDSNKNIKANHKVPLEQDSLAQAHFDEFDKNTRNLIRTTEKTNYQRAYSTNDEDLDEILDKNHVHDANCKHNNYHHDHSPPFHFPLNFVHSPEFHRNLNDKSPFNHDINKHNDFSGPYANPNYHNYGQAPLPHQLPYHEPNPHHYGLPASYHGIPPRPPPDFTNPYPHHHHHPNHNHHHHHPYHSSRQYPNTPYSYQSPTQNGNHYGSDSQKDSTTYLSVALPIPEDKSQNTFPRTEPTNHYGTLSCGTSSEFDCQNGVCLSYDKVCNGKNDCGNRLDEVACDHIGYEVRLSNENGKRHMGRVEVKANGKWGYVCDDQFTITDANVLCRELGFSMGAAEVKTNSFYPPNAGLINGGRTMFMMDEVNCLGNETSLKDCDFNGWGVSDCNAEEVVGVVCKVAVMKCPADYFLCEISEECIPTNFLCDGVKDCADGLDEAEKNCNAKIEYRLAGGSEYEGRVEVRYQGMWGTVCDDDFGVREAYVFCKSLGYTGSAKIINGSFGTPTGPIWLDEVSCLGNETSLDKCMHFNWGESNCNHTEDVSVQCTRGHNTQFKGRHSQQISNNPVELDPINELNLEDVQRSSKSIRDYSNQCGQIKVSDRDIIDEIGQFRVINGHRAKRGYHPWQATLRAKGRNGKSIHWCGAAIISEYHILTAAHCLIGFQKGTYLIRLGDHHSEEQEGTEMEVFIQNWAIHEDFRKGQHMNNDIAVILLKTPIRFTNFIQPICLPPKDTVYEAGKNCTISGWGSIQYGQSTPSLNLQAAHIPLISQNICKQKEFYGDTIMDTMFCAGYLENGVDSCDGDSGGPLVCEEKGLHTLYGIISWGQRCGESTKPGVYVKVSKYIDWIEEKIRALAT